MSAQAVVSSTVVVVVGSVVVAVTQLDTYNRWYTSSVFGKE